MEKTKKINSTELLNIINKFDKEYTELSWNGVDIKIRHTLSFSVMMSFVDYVSKLCFSEESGAYLPEVKDFGIKTSILELYAGIEMPNEIEDMYKLVYHSDLVDRVIERINQTQLAEIVNAIEEKIKHIASANVEAITYQMNDLYNSFANLEKQIGNTFSGVSSDDMAKIANAISGKDLDETKIVEAYMGHIDEKTNVIPINKKGK